MSLLRIRRVTMSVLRNSRWRPGWLQFQTNSELPYYLTLVSNPMFSRSRKSLKWLIKQVVEGVIDNKIQDGRRFKRKQQNSYYPHKSVEFGVNL
jgi:hypothetical protein